MWERGEEERMESSFRVAAKIRKERFKRRQRQNRTQLKVLLRGMEKIRFEIRGTAETEGLGDQRDQTETEMSRGDYIGRRTKEETYGCSSRTWR